jgi:hypothetical protein
MNPLQGSTYQDENLCKLKSLFLKCFYHQHPTRGQRLYHVLSVLEL